jgi:hypothetical protein
MANLRFALVIVAGTIETIWVMGICRAIVERCVIDYRGRGGRPGTHIFARFGGEIFFETRDLGVRLGCWKFGMGPRKKKPRF